MGKLKDANQPKRPLSAFFRWMGTKRVEVKAEFPDLPHKEITKKLGSKWKEMGSERQQPYKDAAREEMKVWKIDMDEYKKTDDYKRFQIQKKQHMQEESKKVKRKKKRKGYKKDLNAPKRPSTGFFLYVADVRVSVKASLPPELQKKVTEVTKICGAQWKEGGDELQAPYKAQAKEAKKIWDEKWAEYKKTDQHRTYVQDKAEWTAAQKEAEQSRNRVQQKQQRRRQVQSDSSSSDSSSSSES